MDSDQFAHIILDVETSGLSHVHHKVLEVGAVVVKGDQLLDEYSSLVNCGAQHLDDVGDDCYALKVNGLKREEILAAPAPEQVATELKAFIAQAFDAFKGYYLHAFNNGFDSRFLAADPWNLSLDLWGPCLMLESQKAMRQAKWPRLLDAASHWGLSFAAGEAHRALADARMAAKVYLAILRARRETHSV